MSWNTWSCPRCRKRNRSNAARCAWCASCMDAEPLLREETPPGRQRNIFAVAERETCPEPQPVPLLGVERPLK